MTDQYVRLQYSDDGGSTWSYWDQEEIGEIGEYGKKIAFTRLGSTYQRVYRVRVTSPRKSDFLGAVTVMRGTVG